MIDWSKAPEWANYIAMDKDGEWWWFASEPAIEDEYWCPMDNGECEVAFYGEHDDWKSSLQKKSDAFYQSPAELNTMDCQGGQ